MNKKELESYWFGNTANPSGRSPGVQRIVAEARRMKAARKHSAQPEQKLAPAPLPLDEEKVCFDCSQHEEYREARVLLVDRSACPCCFYHELDPEPIDIPDWVFSLEPDDF